MNETDGGYRLSLIDSNFPESIQYYDYRFGQTHFSYEGPSNFIPYLAKKGELKRIKKNLKKWCERRFSSK